MSKTHRALGLGLDFGTSNTAAGYMMQGGRPRRISFAPCQTTIPTTFFFDFDTRKLLIGDPANQALLDGVGGRFMRAFKPVLSIDSLYERRQDMRDQVTFVDNSASFLSEVKA